METVNFADALRSRLVAGYGIFHIPTGEELRAETVIGEVAKSLNFHVVTWDAFEGFQPLLTAGQPQKATEHVAAELLALAPVKAPLAALEQVSLFKMPGRRPQQSGPRRPDLMFIFRDIVPLLKQHPPLARTLRSYAYNDRNMKTDRRPIILLGPAADIPPELRADITTLEFELPNEAELSQRAKAALDTFTSALKQAHEDQKHDALVASFEQNRERITSALMGMTATEAFNIVCLGMGEYQIVDDRLIRLIKTEKARIIKRTDVLTYFDEEHVADASQLGGYENMKAFVGRQYQSYTKEAMAAKMDPPKGIVLMGPAGTGKSTAGMSVSKMLDLPLYVLDVGALFSAYVGDSEARTRAVLRQIEAQNGCVLLLDEVDKGFGGVMTAAGDSGVTRRVFGTLLTWLANKKDRTFVIMTLNRISGLPPEFLRAGRFDMIFYTALPGPQERRDILRIHLEKRGVPFDRLSPPLVDMLIEKTDNYSGAEIEQIVRNARSWSWSSRKDPIPNLEEFMRAKEEIVPAYALDKKDMDEIIAYCKTSGAKAVSESEGENIGEPPMRGVTVSGTPSNN